MSVEKNKERNQKRFHQFKMILLVVVIVLLIGVPTFAYFRISSAAHTALREAKNVKLTLQMLDIEYYGMNTSVYDASSDNGLRKGVEEEVENMLEHEGEVILQSYNKKKRTINALTYRNNHYEVVYYNDKEKGDTWTVRYFVTVIQ